MRSAPEAVATGYAGDVAFVHREAHSDFARLAAPTVLEFLRAAGIDAGLVVDLGCGTGVLAAELIAAGYDVLGVDLSADMIALAASTAPGGQFVRASFVDVELPPCAAVVSVGQCLGYGFDPRVGAGGLAGLFGRVAAALRPGGVFVFDLNAPAAGPDHLDGTARLHREESPDWTLLVEETTWRDVVVRDLTLFRRVGDGYRRSDERHVVHLHEPRPVLAALGEAGLTARTFHGYGGADFPAHLVGYHATRPGLAGPAADWS